MEGVGITWQTIHTCESYSLSKWNIFDDLLYFDVFICTLIYVLFTQGKNLPTLVISKIRKIKKKLS